MRSAFPKGLHPVGGKPILARVLEAAAKAGFKDIKVITSEEHQNLTLPIIRSFKAESIIQKSKPGTAGAVMSVPFSQLNSYCLIINGDHPLLAGEDLKNFFERGKAEDIAVGVCTLSEPKNMGRIVRQGEFIEKIVEPHDFTEEISTANEINSGLWLVKTSLLEKNLKLITSDNPKGEYLLTDLISLCFQQGIKAKALEVSEQTAFGVNSQEELALANQFIFEKKIESLMAEGVIFPSPYQTHIEEDVQVGKGSIIYPGVYLKGHSQIGSFCAIEKNCFIFDCIIHGSVHIKAHCYLEKAEVRSKSIVGPFAHLRPGAVIGKECRVGSFAEVKNSQLGDKTKAGHQCYLGDSAIGKEVNIGAGAVICNYAPDKKKYQTKIKDHSFIGSGSMLVSPIEIGENAVIGAGSVITKNVPKETLALSRAVQTHKKIKPKARH